MKFSKSFFFDFCVSKFTPSPIPINKGDLQGDLRMVYGLFTKFEPTHIRINGSAKKCSSLIWKFIGVCGGIEEKIYRKIFSPSPISMKRAVWHPCFEKCSPIVYTPSLNSHRKPQTAPPSEKISLTYMHEKAVLGTMFQYVFTSCLQISPHL